MWFIVLDDQLNGKLLQKFTFFNFLHNKIMAVKDDFDDDDGKTENIFNFNYCVSWKFF